MVEKRLCLLLCILHLFYTALPGREPEPVSPDSGPLSEIDEIPDEEESSLYEKTLKKDIDTASYYELVAWVRILELSDKGSAEDLRKLLYSYYGIEEEDKSPLTGSVITIKSAHDTDYFTIDEKDLQMIRLTGDVQVEMEESDSNRRHIIKADELIFNQTENTLTASGNLEYRLISGDSEDLFHGDSLTFSVTSWNGVIFKGVAYREKEVDGSLQTFYLNGEKIRKSGNGGVFILEDGTVKTQDVDNPDFHLDAKRLWLMGPKEWGIRHGILYIGHVPVLYIPFYYKPGNEMIFNPVIGRKSREGNFIQTTTYLIGRKESSEDSSLFMLGDSDEGNYTLVREGLYLMKENTPPDDPISKDTLKVMVDWYSRLGVFSGVQGSFYEKEALDSLEFSSAIGVSRTISDTNSIYFPDGSDYRTDWNSIAWGSAEYPFRWGQTLGFETEQITGSFQFYSDPYFNQDFMDREESFDWLNALMTSQMTSEDEPDEITDMQWSLVYSNVFTPELTAPYIQKIDLSRLRFLVDWDSKSNSSTDLKDNDPAREFFFPDKIDLPYAKVSISGTPFSYSTTEGWGWAREPERQEDTGDLIPPWETDDSQEEDESSGRDDSLKPGELWKTQFKNYERVVYQNSFSYEITSLADLEAETGSSEWDTPEDVSFKMDESLFLFNNSLSTIFSNKFFDNTFGIINKNDLSLNYRKHIDAFGADTDTLEESDLDVDYKYHSINWDNNMGTYYYPLKQYEPLSSSKWTYNIDNKLYEKAFDSYNEAGDPVYKHEWASWDKETINQHNTGMVISYKPGIFSYSSNAKYDLPPLDRQDTYTNTAGLDVFNWKSSLSQTTILSEKEWTFDPLIFSTSYEPFNSLFLKQNLEYDFEEDTFSKSISYMKVWGYFIEYTMEYTTPYEWDKENLTWVSQDEAFVPSTFKTGYTLEFESDLFWKNRVSTGTDLTLDWTVNLQQYNDNSLSFTWEYDLNIFQFLDLHFSMKSGNDSMYLYIPYYREKLGIDREYDFFEDLFQSFNMFSPNQQDRHDSFFNMKELNLELVHHLRDWDLTLSYSGWPELENTTYEWQSEFSIFLKWNPIPKIQSDIQYKDNEWLVDTQKGSTS